jgi:hypothetical protein
VDVEEIKKPAGLLGLAQESESVPPIADFNNKILLLLENVKKYYQGQEERKTAKVVPIDTTPLPVDYKDTRAVIKWVRDQLQGKQINIQDDGSIVIFTRSGIEDSGKQRGE